MKEFRPATKPLRAVRGTVESSGRAAVSLLAGHPWRPEMARRRVRHRSVVRGDRGLLLARLSRRGRAVGGISQYGEG